MKRVFWILALALAAMIGLYLGGTYAYKNRLYTPISDMFDAETKRALRDTVLVFQTKARLEEEVAALNRRLEQTEEVQELFEVALRNNPNLPESLPFHFVSDQVLEAGQDSFAVTRYETPFIPLSHFGRRAYLETYGDDLLLITAKGTIGRVSLAEITDSSFDMRTLRSNLPELIPQPEFYEFGELSIKDALVRDDALLLSYSKVVSEGCYTLAVAEADLRSEPLIFQDIFVPDDCVLEDNAYGAFDANQSGGRILASGPDLLLLSSGDWVYRDLAQDPDSFFGKIVEVDLKTGSYEVKSMGHRNPQGLYYDAQANVIINSEHGPQGGDEININRSPDGEPKNFGWPVSSYGEHYSTNPKEYERAPLHKSHADHGFVEPAAHFVPSISPSEILRLAEDPRDPERYAILMGSMGFDYREGDHSMYVIDLDDTFTITAQNRIILDARVRDMVALPTPGHYALYLEGDDYTFGAIALVRHMR